ncbi:T9SS type A sorting domain-containing protein [Candidatus Poribacteria bacterium]|nr:T9SS type A sorting domain-containing protein [Candidatus Poribacteria bacterium]
MNKKKIIKHGIIAALVLWILASSSSFAAPVLNPTGNSYTHEHDPIDNDPWLKGILVLTFVEVVDVSTLTDLSKISLKVGVSTVTLSNDIAEVTTMADGTTVEIRTKNTDAAKAKVNEISGLGREYDMLYVEIAAGAIKDLSGNPNALMSQRLNIWTKDSVKPPFNPAASSYMHDDGSENHYAKLMLQFLEQMDTRAACITAANIEIANAATGGDSITLAQAEIPPQDFSSNIVFYLSDAHRDTISKWGAPDAMGDPDHQGFATLYIRLAADAVSDRAGNGNATMTTRAALGAWIKDITPPEYVSSAYNANNKQFTITFKEWMDAKPMSLVNPANLTITDKDGGNLVTLNGAGVSESDMTKTITVTLTPAQDMSVKPLAKPLKLNMAVGAAKDIAGNNNAAVSGKEITYTEDTTPPGLDTKDGFLDSRYVHPDKRLMLNFNEAIDKSPYTDIDATKITLLNAASGGVSFSLTQAEIERLQPGDIVQPSDVDMISFILSVAHWKTVAGWSAIYVQIAAGAVKDTTGNPILAIGPIRIHPDNVRMDTTPPDVRLPESYVKEAAVGTDVTITATVMDDVSVKWARLYYQMGGALKAFIVMVNTTGDTYEGTIPGTAVTNKGLCYYILAEDHVGNRNMVGNQIKTRKGDKDEWWYTNIPGGFNITVTGAIVTLPANTLPVFDPTAVPSKYRMISVPIDASIASTTLFAPFGTPGVDWQAWRYTEAAEFNGYQPGHASGGFTLSKGEAAWIGTIKPDAALTVAGTPLKIAAADNAYKAEIKLRAGWNQIGCPFNFSRNWDAKTIGIAGGNIDNKIYWFTGETSNYSFASTDPTVPNQTVFATHWKTAADFEDPATGSGWPGTLDPWGGYLVYAYAEGTILTIDPTVPGKGVLPVSPTAPSTQMPYNWSVKVTPEAGGVSGTAKFAGIVSDATDGIDKYDVMDLPALPGQVIRLSFITEEGDYLQDMKAPADEMFWHFKVSSAVNAPVILRFDAKAVPSEYRTIILIDTATEAATDLRKMASYTYKPSEKIKNFKLIISKAHPEIYIVPKHSALLQNYPNPFNPETWVPYRLSTAGDVTIKIYNVTGQLVRTLELGYREAGSYTVKERAAYWNGRNDKGERIASGVYFYHIYSNSFHATKKMVIVK